MTADDYISRSKVLHREADRLRAILDDNAVKRARGIPIDGVRIDKARKQYAQVFEDIGALEREFWDAPR